MKNLLLGLILLGSVNSYAYEVTCGEGGGPGSGSNSMCNGSLSNSSSFGSDYAREVLADIREKRKINDKINEREYEDRLQYEDDKKHGKFKDFSYVGENKSSFSDHGHFTKTDTGLRFGENGELYRTNYDFEFHFDRGLDGKVYLIRINDNYTLFHGGQYALARLTVDSSDTDMGRIYNIFLPNGLHSDTNNLLEGYEQDNFSIIRELDSLELIYNPILEADDI